MLTQARLKELFTYNKTTGFFKYKISRGRCMHGDIAGSLSTRRYVRIRIDNIDYGAHRLVFMYITGEWPKDQVDHKNQIKDDNRWTNLRDCTPEQNQGNVPLRSNNTSGYKGVCWNKKTEMWISRISHKSKRISLGSFTCKHEAAGHYNNAALKYFGEFAYLNEINK